MYRAWSLPASWESEGTKSRAFSIISIPKPNKGKSTDRIDGVVSAIMALGRAMLAEAAAEDEGTTVPDDSEVLVV